MQYIYSNLAKDTYVTMCNKQYHCNWTLMCEYSKVLRHFNTPLNIKYENGSHHIYLLNIPLFDEFYELVYDFGNEKHIDIIFDLYEQYAIPKYHIEKYIENYYLGLNSYPTLDIMKNYANKVPELIDTNIYKFSKLLDNAEIDENWDMVSFSLGFGDEIIFKNSFVEALLTFNTGIQVTFSNVRSKKHTKLYVCDPLTFKIEQYDILNRTSMEYISTSIYIVTI